MSFDLVITSDRRGPPAGEQHPEHPWAHGTLPLGDDRPRWRAIAEEMQADAAAWADAGWLLFLADDVEMSAEAVSDLFRIMHSCELRVAQPSLAWQSHFAEPTTLHNPSFVFRWANRVDMAAIAFHADTLRQCLPLLQGVPDEAALARLLPACLDEPLRACAIVDAVEASRTAAPAPHEAAEPAWPAALAVDGAHREPSFSWGGLSLRGTYSSLFDGTRDEFLGGLAAGYACAVQETEPIGEVFLQHFARSIEPAPQALRLGSAPAPTPALRPSPIFDRAAAAARAARTASQGAHA
jgi:hypothetical protein